MTYAQMLQYRTDFEGDESSWGRGLMVGAEVLLGMSVVPFCLLYQGVRDGSEFWTWWIVIQGGIALVMYGVGWLLQR